MIQELPDPALTTFTHWTVTGSNQFIPETEQLRRKINEIIRYLNSKEIKEPKELDEK